MAIARGSARTFALAGGAAIVLAACTGSTRGSYQYDWSLFVDSIIHPDGLILFGIWLTISISIVSQLIGVVLGVFGALGRMSRFLPFRLVANFYVWFLRGTPLLVQLTFFYFGLSVTKLYTWPPINLLGVVIPSEVQAGVFALGLNEGAYMTEIVRAGILSVDRGQMEAAKSLGMTYGQAMRRIILPQAARIIVPPLGNEFNNMLKTTSLLVILGNVPELYVTFSRKNGSLFHPFELFLAAAFWYLVLTTIWSLFQTWIERRLARGTPGAPSEGPGLRDRLFGVRRSSADASLVSGGR
ncbi:MAG TPA: amino acid ABC transporter permease [Candidatus Limnocylindrales bacterium]|nr:amino acid ABC transporter permease [Candidatus Limnocylindrales bacterium]